MTKPKETAVELSINKRVRDMLETLKERTGKKATSQEIQQMLCDSRKQEFLKYFHESGGNAAFACSMIGISRHSFENWRRDDPQFKESVADVNEMTLDMAEAQLLKNISDGKEMSLVFFLCNKGRHRGWTSLNKLDNKVVVPVQINVEYADKTVKQIRVSESEPKELPISTGNEEKD